MTTDYQTMTRPLALTWFKRIMVASIVFGLLTQPLALLEISRLMEIRGSGQYTRTVMAWLVLGQLVLSAVVYFVVCLIADDGYKFPRRLFAWSAVSGMIVLLASLPTFNTASPIQWLYLVQTVTSFLVVPLLLTSSAREWSDYKRKERADLAYDRPY